MIKIFYSWQSDLPNNTNRNFIQECIEKAISLITKQKPELEIDPNVDRDIQGKGGSPHIASTIFEKISKDEILLFDVTPICKNEFGDYTPNSNVLIELGYGLKSKGFDRTIMVMNTFYVPPEQLPFDLRHQFITTYKLKGDDTPEEKRRQKEELTGKIKNQLLEILNSHLNQANDESENNPKIDISLDIESKEVRKALAQAYHGITNVTPTQSFIENTLIVMMTNNGKKQANKVECFIELPLVLLPQEYPKNQKDVTEKGRHSYYKILLDNKVDKAGMKPAGYSFGGPLDYDAILPGRSFPISIPLLEHLNMLDDEQIANHFRAWDWGELPIEWQIHADSAPTRLGSIKLGEIPRHA